MKRTCSPWFRNGDRSSAYSSNERKLSTPELLKAWLEPWRMISTGAPLRLAIWPVLALKVVEPLGRSWCTNRFLMAPSGLTLWA